MNFEALQDLVRIVSRNKLKHIEVFGSPTPDGDLLEKFYNGLWKEKYASEDEAAKKLMGTNSKDQRFKRLKNRLIRQLISSAFFVDTQQPMYNERTKAYYSCYRDFAAVYTIMGMGSSQSAMWLIQQLLEQTIKFEFTHLTADLTRELRRIYLRHASDPENLRKYTELNKLYERKRYYEQQSTNYYEDLLTYYATNRSANVEIYDMGIRHWEELSPLMEEIDTLSFYHDVYAIGVLAYVAINNYEKALALSEEGLTILKSRKSTNRSAIGNLLMQKMSCITQLRRLDEGDSIFEEVYNLTIAQSYNWYKIKGLNITYYFYTKRYSEILPIYAEVTQSERFALMQPIVKDEWVLYSGYLHLLAALGQLDTAQVEAVVGPLKLTKIVNDIEVLDKEKAGINIPLVLLPVLFSIVSGAYQEYGVSPEALEKYRQRHLNNDTNRRSDTFLRLLLALEERKYTPKESERKIEKLLIVLASEPPQTSKQSYAVEIVPYEDLWHLISTI
jgi:tetratricopeptide (TPR) repeat protein